MFALIGLSQAIKSVFMTLTEIAALIIKLAANGGRGYFYFVFVDENQHSLSRRLTVTSSSDPRRRTEASDVISRN